MMKTRIFGRFGSSISKGFVAAAVFVLALPMMSAVAQAASPGGYIGGAVGYSDDKLFDDSDTGWKLFAGYNFNEYFGLEGSYVDLGTTEDAGLKSSQDGWGLALVGNIPASDRFDFRVKVGGFNWDVKLEGPFAGRVSDDGTDVFYGVGFNYQMSDVTSVGLEWERYQDISGGDFDLYSLFLSFSF